MNISKHNYKPPPIQERARMILIRTPIRISFVGGGTDLPFFYENHDGGQLVSASAKIYIDVWVRPRSTYDIGINNDTYENADDIPDPLLKQVFRRTGVRKGVYLLAASDIPTGGVGLGSSSAFLVGALNALYRYQGIGKVPGKLAKEACEIEANDLGLASGKQDAYTSAHGGLNYIEVYPCGTTKVFGIYPPQSVWDHLNSHFLLFFTGVQRRSHTILAKVEKNKDDNVDVLREIKKLVKPFRQALENPSDRIGELLHEYWQLKCQTAPEISNAYFNSIYETARDAGVIGGKILGAGGGGFFMFYAKPEKHDTIRDALADLQEFPLAFSQSGSRPIYEQL